MLVTNPHPGITLWITCKDFAHDCGNRVTDVIITHLGV